MMANDTFTAKWRWVPLFLSLLSLSLICGIIKQNGIWDFDFSAKRMEEDEGLRTLECLRGRLLAERAASKAANDESEQIGKKVIELEKQLKMEIKSRNKAEKRLKFLMKKLESLKISYVSADESSSFSEKSGISSVSSSSKSQDQADLQKTQFKNTSDGDRRSCPSHEDNFGSVDESVSGNSNENVIQPNQKDDDALKKDDDNNGSKSPITKNNDNDEGHIEDIDYNVDNSMALVIVEDTTIRTSRHDEDRDDGFDNDNSMALVVVDNVVKEEKQGVSISNSNVKNVLDALRYARESLQRSMEMRQHMRSNIACGRFNKISC